MGENGGCPICRNPIKCIQRVFNVGTPHIELRKSTPLKSANEVEAVRTPSKADTHIASTPLRPKRRDETSKIENSDWQLEIFSPYKSVIQDGEKKPRKRKKKGKRVRPSKKNGTLIYVPLRLKPRDVVPLNKSKASGVNHLSHPKSATVPPVTKVMKLTTINDQEILEPLPKTRRGLKSKARKLRRSKARGRKTVLDVSDGGLNVLDPSLKDVQQNPTRIQLSDSKAAPKLEVQERLWTGIPLPLTSSARKSIKTRVETERSLNVSAAGSSMMVKTSHPVTAPLEHHFECEYLCGFEGTFGECQNHERVCAVRTYFPES